MKPAGKKNTMNTIDIQGLETIFVTGTYEVMDRVIPILKSIGFKKISDRENAYEFNTGINAPLANAFDDNPNITYMGMPISEATAIKIANALIEEVKGKLGVVDAPTKFEVWATEINRDWSDGYSATATENSTIMNFYDNFYNNEVARIEYKDGKYIVTGTDKNAVEALENMVNR